MFYDSPTAHLESLRNGDHSTEVADRVGRVRDGLSD